LRRLSGTGGFSGRYGSDAAGARFIDDEAVVRGARHGLATVIATVAVSFAILVFPGFLLTAATQAVGGVAGAIAQ
jgi:hypothetical protein